MLTVHYLLEENWVLVVLFHPKYIYIIICDSIHTALVPNRVVTLFICGPLLLGITWFPIHPLPFVFLVLCGYTYIVEKHHSNIHMGVHITLTNSTTLVDLCTQAILFSLVLVPKVLLFMVGIWVFWFHLCIFRCCSLVVPSVYHVFLPQLPGQTPCSGCHLEVLFLINYQANL